MVFRQAILPRAILRAIHLPPGIDFVAAVIIARWVQLGQLSEK
jgi:hypothetical protein